MKPTWPEQPALARRPARDAAHPEPGGYLASSQDLRSGLQVVPLSLAQLPCELIAELLRLRRGQPGPVCGRG